MPSKEKLEFRIGDGFHVNKADGEALIGVVKKKFKNTIPTPAQLVSEARKKSSPIHHMFEWDVSRAAHAYWLREAQYYLGSLKMVKVSIETGEVVSGPVRAFIPVEKQGHRVVRYEQASRFVDRPTKRNAADIAAILGTARAEFRAWLNRYRSYVEFLDMFDSVIKSFDRVEKKMDSEHPSRKTA